MGGRIYEIWFEFLCVCFFWFENGERRERGWMEFIGQKGRRQEQRKGVWKLEKRMGGRWRRKFKGAAVCTF